MHGLLHDAHEAYSGDLTRPMKLALKRHNTLCNLDDIEGEISCAVFQAFDLGELSRQDFARIIAADDDMLATEFRDLMPESDFKAPGTPASFRIKPQPWDVAEQKFLKKFHDLASITCITPIFGALT